MGLKPSTFGSEHPYHYTRYMLLTIYNRAFYEGKIKWSFLAQSPYWKQLDWLNNNDCILGWRSICKNESIEQYSLINIYVLPLIVLGCQYKKFLVNICLHVKEQIVWIFLGQPVAAVFEQGTLKLNWKDVFNTFHGVPHHYSLVVGSRDGFSDVAEVIYTRDHVYDVIVPSSTFVSPDLNEMYIKITCTYSTGLFSIYSTSYKLWYM